MHMAVSTQRRVPHARGRRSQPRGNISGDSCVAAEFWRLVCHQKTNCAGSYPGLKRNVGGTVNNHLKGCFYRGTTASWALIKEFTQGSVINVNVMIGFADVCHFLDRGQVCAAVCGNDLCGRRTFRTESQLTHPIMSCILRTHFCRWIGLQQGGLCKNRPVISTLRLQINLRKRTPPHCHLE